MTTTSTDTGRDLEPLLRLATVSRLGPKRARALLDAFGSAEAVLADPDRAMAVEGVGPGITAGLRRAAGEHGSAAVVRIRRRLEEIGARAIASDDPEYPPGLLRLHDPPFILFAQGNTGLAAEPGVAVVGTRQPTQTGRRVGRDMGRELALAGHAVVSGVARGIDTEAHLGALEGGGRTIGVLGHGIGVPFPRRNRTVYQRMAETGLILSEFPPGEPPIAGNFPRRNRLIAALAQGVVVVEMAVRSGAQHTVNFALELGLEVFAVPGPVTSRVSRGTNRLLRDGARPITCAADLLEDLGYDPARTAAAGGSPGEPPGGSDEGEVLRAVEVDPRSVDEICVRVDLPAERVLAALLTLELDGRIEGLPGNRYRTI